jgi:hypothetical protein
MMSPTAAINDVLDRDGRWRPERVRRQIGADVSSDGPRLQ